MAQDGAQVGGFTGVLSFLAARAPRPGDCLPIRCGRGCGVERALYEVGHGRAVSARRDGRFARPAGRGGACRAPALNPMMVPLSCYPVIWADWPAPYHPVPVKPCLTFHVIIYNPPALYLRRNNRTPGHFWASLRGSDFLQRSKFFNKMECINAIIS
jgi:hypothetical protein